jgi:hypothetical protein
MGEQEAWRTEEYKGMEVHVSALRGDASELHWHYAVRIAQPGEDAGSASELTAQSADSEAGFPSEEAAIDAGFLRGYAMVDALTN